MKKVIGRAIALGLAMTISLPVYANGQNEQEALELKKSQAQELLLEDNSTLMGLEVTEMELLSSFGDIVEAGRTLESVYQQLPRYEALEVKKNTTMNHSDYAAYFNLLQKGVGLGRESDLDQYKSELEVEDIVANGDLIADLEQRISYEASFSEEDYAVMMTPIEYGEYLGLATMFAGFGISNATVSDEDIYDIFIQTIEIAPLSLQAALESLQLNMSTVERSLVSGMSGLYDTILSLEKTGDILYISYMSAVDKAEASDLRLSLALETSQENRQAHIDMAIAKMNYDKMVRQIDSTSLSLKSMLGIDQVVSITLEEALDVDVNINSISDVSIYVDKALEARSEIIIARTAVTNKEREISLLETWFKASSNRTQDAKEELRRLERDLFQVERDIVEDVSKAYNKVITTIVDTESAKGALRTAQSQYSELVLRQELGYMLEADLKSAQLSLISTTNSVILAENAYQNAMRALENASSVGPGYQ